MLPRNITMLQRSPRVGGDVMKFAPKSSLAGREGVDSGLVVCGVVQAICKKKRSGKFRWEIFDWEESFLFEDVVRNNMPFFEAKTRPFKGFCHGLLASVLNSQNIH